MADLNRRTLLGGAVAVGAAAGPSNVLAEGFSADFREWYALAKTQNEALRADDDWEAAHPGASGELLQSSPWNRHSAALFEIEARIFERALNGGADVHTVAEVGMIALYWSDKDERSKRRGIYEYDPFELGCDPDTVPGACAQGDRAQFVLIQAAAKLYLIGGLHG